ncbi:unnamed protein product [Ascophyllum nodosum]
MRSCALLFILVERSSGLATPADAALSPSTTTLTLPRAHSFRFGGQARETAAAAMPPIFKLRGRLLYLSARAAFAASAGSYAMQAPLESSRPPRSNLPWLRSSWPVLSRAASSASNTLAGNISSTRRSFRSGSSIETPDGTLPAALKAWTWKNCQGILMPPLDRRHYRWLVLPNGLQVMVISDPSSTKAAAAMSVDTGAASDPKTLPGLAHFLEHMLFLAGTSKYPAENAYKSYLAKHGGKSNASTAMDATTFQFEVGAEHLRRVVTRGGALDIFSQFFVSPLLTESSTGRELMAVDSEDSKNRTNDSRRLLQVLKALADPDHPYSKFSTGNAKTLRDDVPEGIDTRQELLAFLERHYSAPHMALVVLGKENLDVLEEWATSCFEEARVSGLIRATDDEADAASKEEPAEAAQTGETGDKVKVESGSETSTTSPTAISGGGSVADELAGMMWSPWRTPPAMTVDLQPLREMRRLMIQWPMPPVQRLWRNSPTRVLSHLMGHEGSGSLFAVLQDQGLATSVSAGLRTSHEDFSLFQVDVGLTEEGEKRWRDVAGLVHAHARLVKELSRNDVQRIWKEARDMSAIYLRFQQEKSPYNAVTSLSRRLQLYPFQEALTAGGVLDPEIDHDLFSAFADYLKPENTLTWRVWKRNRNEDSRDGVKEEEESGAGQARSTELTREPEAQELQERWYGVKYGAAPTPPELIRAWGSPNDDSALSVPGPNVFIPDDFSLVCDRKDYSTGTIKDSDSDPDGEGSGSVSANLNVDAINVNEEAVEKGGGVIGSCEGDGVIGEGGEGTSSVGIAGPRLSSSGGEKVPLGEPQRGVLKAPDLLREDTDCREGVEKDGHLWHRLDTSFRQPRAYSQIVLGTPVVREQGAQASVHAGIMADILSTVLAQRTYDASLAGLGWKVGPHPCGYVLQVSGFSQKIEPLLQEVAEAFLDPEAAAGGPKAFAKQFDLAKERAVRRARSWSMNRPDDIAHYYSSKALEFPRDLELDPGHLKASQAATLEGCLSLHREALSRVFPVGLVYGNASPDDARRMWRTVTKRLHDAGCQVLPEEAYPRSLVGVLPMGKRVNVRADVPNQDDENSAAIAYWQLGERDERRFATLLLLGQMMREPCFTELRTKQQIGYIVSSGLHSHGRGGRQLGFSVDALSKTMGPDEICERIDAFVPWFRETVASMSQEEFDTHVQSLITKRLEPPKKATDEFSRIRNEIFPGDLKWNRAAALAEMLASVKREDVLELIDRELLADDTSKRMNVLVYGKDRPRPSPNTSSEERNARTIELVPETLREFVASLPMYDTTITGQNCISLASRLLGIRSLEVS